MKNYSAFEVIISERAQQNVREILKYLDENWPPNVKIQFIIRLKRYLLF